MSVPVVTVHGFSFTDLLEVVAAYRLDEVVTALGRVEEQVARGRHAAGFLCYEAAAAFDATLVTREPEEGFPLLWFGIFRTRSDAPTPRPVAPFASDAWRASLSPGDYRDAVRTVRNFIEAGDCYQVNLTLRQRFSFSGCAASWYADLVRSQPTPYASYLDLGRFRILSASPELFFRLEKGVLTTRPMKGTAARGRWTAEDAAAKEILKTGAKERAENLMIVDLLRNDMGAVSRTGSVTVKSLFDVETLPSVHQMTSTIESRLREGVGLVELLRALFPCGSVTGAPKRRSMEIIAQLEDSPRKVYTGCIGYLSPGGEAQFSVPIRTAIVDTATGMGELGIGSGITHDSGAQAEYAECLAKGSFARHPYREFALIESLLYDGDGYYLLERHLARLERSAGYFSFPFDADAALQALAAAALPLRDRHKVRLLLKRDGALSCEAAAIAPPCAAVTAAFATERVDPADAFLYHKTTWRPLYSAQSAQRPDCGEVIFLNEAGEVTEGANSNVVALIKGELVTPPLCCGLLPGVLREELLELGTLRERVLTAQDLHEADEVHLINSVRGWRRAALVA